MLKDSRTSRGRPVRETANNRAINTDGPGQRAFGASLDRAWSWRALAEPRHGGDLQLPIALKTTVHPRSPGIRPCTELE